jgi:hypothetical protein
VVQALSRTVVWSLRTSSAPRAGDSIPCCAT